MRKDNVVSLMPGYGEAPDATLLEHVSETYSIGECLGWRPLRTGDEPSFLLLARTGDYILRRMSRERSAASLTFEVNLTSFLRRAGFPAVELLPTPSGSLYSRYDGASYTLAVSRQGELFDLFDFDNDGHLAAAAGGLAAYHRAVAAFPGPLYLGSNPDLWQGLSDAKTTLAKVGGLPASNESAALRESLAYLEEQVAEMRESVGAIYRREQKLVIHGSFDDGSLMFDAGDLVCVDSFRHAALDIRALDIVCSMTALCVTKKRRRDAQPAMVDCERSQSFINTYRSAAQLRDEDVRAVSTVLRARQLVQTLDECEAILRPSGTGVDVPETASRIERLLSRLRDVESDATELVAAWSA